MIFIISFIFLFFLLAINQLSCVDKFSRIIINVQTIWWIGLIFISALNLFTLRPVSIYTYSLLFCYVFFLNIGFLTANGFFKNESFQIRRKFIYNELSFYVKSKFFYFLLIVMLGISAVILHDFIDIILLSSFSDAHFARLSTDLFGSPILMITYNNLIVPFSLFAMFIMCLLLIKQQYNFCFFLCLLFVLIVFGIGFGKNMILMLFFQLLLIGFILYKIDFKELIGKYAHDTSILKRIIQISLLLIFITLVFSSLRRTNDFVAFYSEVEESLKYFAEEIIVYLVGPFRALDYAVHTESFLADLGGMNLGRTTILGFEKLLEWMVTFLGFSYNSAYELVGQTLQDARISVMNSESDFNFAFSSMLYFYLDFRFWGVIIIPYTIGFLERWLIHRATLHLTLPIFALIIYIVMCCLMGFFSWEFSKPGPCAYLIYLALSHCLLVRFSSKIHFSKTGSKYVYNEYNQL